MKILRMVSYLIHAIHLGAQFFLFWSWNDRVGELSGQASNIDVKTLVNTNLAIGQASFVYLSIVLFALAFYVTVANILSNMMIAQKIESVDICKVPEKESEDKKEEE